METTTENIFEISRADQMAIADIIAPHENIMITLLGLEAL